MTRQRLCAPGEGDSIRLIEATVRGFYPIEQITRMRADGDEQNWHEPNVVLAGEALCEQNIHTDRVKCWPDRKVAHLSEEIEMPRRTVHGGEFAFER